MSDKVIAALSKHINFEISSAYLYLGMSIKMHDANYKGYSNWLLKQYHEELLHAEDFLNFAQKRDFVIELAAIEAPIVTAVDPLEIAKLVLAHEQKVTKAIYELHDTAKQANDYATEIFLHKYIEEQIEEEDSAKTIIDKFTFAGESASARYVVDRELSAR